MKNKLGKWIEYFKQNGITAMPTDSNLGKGTKEILKLVQKLMKDELEKAEQKGRVKKNIKIMILVSIPQSAIACFLALGFIILSKKELNKWILKEKNREIIR